MLHARDDYSMIQDPSGKIPAGEPVFLLRATDRLAAEVIEKWADLASEAGATDETVEAARKHAQRIRDYQKTHGSKVPDVKPDQII